MQYSNIIIVVMGVLRDQNLYLEYIKNHNIPKRLSMILYLVDESHEYYKHFPVNYLRSWGISNVLTSHYIVLDMDIHFSGILTFLTRCMLFRVQWLKMTMPPLYCLSFFFQG